MCDAFFLLLLLGFGWLGTFLCSVLLGFFNGLTWNEDLEDLKRNLKLAVILPKLQHF